jgi:hypothetical protein
MSDSVTDLIRDCVSLLHPAFYRVADARSSAFEFYHQFRKLWDKGVPVGYGLGHVIIDPVGPVTFVIRRLAEGSVPAAELAIIHFGDDAPSTATHIIRDGRLQSAGSGNA